MLVHGIIHTIALIAKDFFLSKQRKFVEHPFQHSSDESGSILRGQVIARREFLFESYSRQEPAFLITILRLPKNVHPFLLNFDSFTNNRNQCR